MAGVIILGIVFLPVVVILYCIPSVRAAFDQLAYEDAMRELDIISQVKTEIVMRRGCKDWFSGSMRALDQQ